MHIQNKPVFTWMLAWFIAFGPVLAVVVYDWRSAWQTLAVRPYLAAYLAAFAVLAHVGGHDTERYLFWSMPVVYLLVAQALERQRVLWTSTYLTAVAVVAQVVSARIFWPIPSPSAAVGQWDEVPAGAPQVYALLNRLFIIDDFHWNLWSNFGSRSFHALLLAVYLVVTIGLILWLHIRQRTLTTAKA